MPPFPPPPPICTPGGSLGLGLEELTFKKLAAVAGALKVFMWARQYGQKRASVAALG